MENGLGVKVFLSRGLKAFVWLFTHPAHQVGSLPLANNALHSPTSNNRGGGRSLVSRLSCTTGTILFAAGVTHTVSVLNVFT